MRDQTTKTLGTWSKELIERASGLNEIGAHYFTGWLISAGFQRPEVMMELERLLHDMENNPDLRHCWMKQDATAGPVITGNDSILPSPPEPEAQVIPREISPRLVADLPAPPNPLGSPAPIEHKRARRPLLPKRLLQALFGKPRLAA